MDIADTKHFIWKCHWLFRGVASLEWRCFAGGGLRFLAGFGAEPRKFLKGSIFWCEKQTISTVLQDTHLCFYCFTFHCYFHFIFCWYQKRKGFTSSAASCWLAWHKTSSCWEKAQRERETDSETAILARERVGKLSKDADLERSRFEQTGSDKFRLLRRVAQLRHK